MVFLRKLKVRPGAAPDRFCAYAKLGLNSVNRPGNQWVSEVMPDAAPAPAQPMITLNSGHEIPQIGLGVWQATGGDETRAVLAALEAGYRHVDTAAIYKNEAGVGRALAQTDVPRAEVFVTTKLWNEDIRQGRAETGFGESLDELGLDYVDLYLLHWPVEGGIEAYRALERLHASGRARSIGVSNYMPEHLEALLAATDVVPAVNQVEFHPRCQQRDVLEACARHGIAITAWSPLMQGTFKAEPLLEEIARPYGKTAAQVLLRWDLQRGVVTIPKSTNPGRIRENFDVLDFALSDEEMARIDALDRGRAGRIGPDPRDFGF